MPASAYIRDYAQPQLEQKAPREAAGYRQTGAKSAAAHPPASLTPGEDLMFGCLLRDEECCVIRDSWRPSLPTVVLPPYEFDELVTCQIPGFVRA